MYFNMECLCNKIPQICPLKKINSLLDQYCYHNIVSKQFRLMQYMFICTTPIVLRYNLFHKQKRKICLTLNLIISKWIFTLTLSRIFLSALVCAVSFWLRTIDAFLRTFIANIVSVSLPVVFFARKTLP